MRLARIGGGSTDHLFIYDLSLENYLKVGVFKMEIPFVSEKNVTVYIYFVGGCHLLKDENSSVIQWIDVD